MPKNNKTRRNFLIKWSAFGAALPLYRLGTSTSKADKTTYVIDKEGNRYVVEKIRVPEMCSKKVSNKRLLNWMSKENESQDEE